MASGSRAILEGARGEVRATNLHEICTNMQLVIKHGATPVRICSKCVDYEILLNFGKCFHTFQGGFENFILELCFFTTKYALGVILFLQVQSIYRYIDK